MNQGDFQIINGQVYVPLPNPELENDISNEKIHDNTQIYVDEIQVSSLYVTESNSHNMSLFKSEDLTLIEPKNQKQRKKKSKGGKARNSQNSIRTIIRRIKLQIKDKYVVQQAKFFESNDPRYLLALFKSEAQVQNLDHIKKYIQTQFQDQLNLKNSLELKQKKLYLFLSFFLDLEENDLETENIEKVLKKLSTTGQLKSHPPKENKFTLLQFNKIMSLLQLRKN